MRGGCLGNWNGLGGRRAWGLCALLTLLGIAGPGQDASAQGEVWEEVAGLQVVMADASLPLARVFDSPDYLHQLVVPEDGGGAFVLDLKAQSVSSLPGEAISWSEDDLPVPDLAQASELGLFLNDEGILSFQGETGSYIVRPEPPLVGEITAEKLMASKPDYVHAAAKYVPGEKEIVALGKVKTPTVVKVFFGTWCSYCKHYLPQLMKTVQAANNPAIRIEYIGVSEDQSEPAELLGKYDVSLTPTFLVLQNGTELGRFEEEPLVSVEADLAHILKVGS